MKLIFPFSIMLAMCSMLLAGDTNTVFVTEVEGSFNNTYLESEHGRWIDPAKIAEAKKMRECLSAADFPEGNWSELVDGIQISLRLDKQAYTIHEPIMATVLLRNVTNNSLFFHYSNKVTLGAVNYQVYTESNQIVVSKPDFHGLHIESGSWINVGIGIQRKFVDNVRDTYDLPKGRYLVQASITASPIGATNFSGFFPIKSVKLPIEIK